MSGRYKVNVDNLLARSLPNNGVIEGKLPEDDTKNLWKLIDEAKKKPEDIRKELAGNITSSIRLDSQSPLVETFVKETVNSFVNKHIETYGFPYRLVIKEGQTLAVNSLWVNFQRQTEFNPMHDHAGVYSFVIWMQIPTSFEEQRKLPIAINSNASTQISNFAFTYTDILGNICSFIYNMEKQAEGFMVLFPASLHHLVNPFYNNDGERISISGNISVI